MVDDHRRQKKKQAEPPPIRTFDGRSGPPRWRCKRCGKERRRSECLHCGNEEAITNEARVSGLAW